MVEARAVLVRASAALAAGDGAALERALSVAVKVAPQEAVEECLLQSFLFVGYPAALRALATWRRVSGLPAAASAEPVSADWRARGEATCRTVYGAQYDRLRDNIGALHPAMEQWMIVEGYGRVLGRPGLDLAARELCVVALLAPQDAAPQLYAHLRGALNAGASTQDVQDAVELIGPMLSQERRRVLAEQWDAVRARRGGARTES